MTGLSDQQAIALTYPSSSSYSSYDSNGVPSGRRFPIVNSRLAKLVNHVQFLPPPPTATSLEILEKVPKLLQIPLVDEDSQAQAQAHAHSSRSRGTSKARAGSGHGGPSLIQGFRATVPSSEFAKQRRRRVRGGLADEELLALENRDGDGGSNETGGKIGGLNLKRLGDRARGLLTEDGEDGEGENGDGDGGGEDGPQAAARRRRRLRRGRGRSSRHARTLTSTAGHEFTLEELSTQCQEISVDKENIRVRRELITGEVEEVEEKIRQLETIRDRLENGLLRLQEEDLELDDERECAPEAFFSFFSAYQLFPFFLKCLKHATMY